MTLEVVQMVAREDGCLLPGQAFPDWQRDFGRSAPAPLSLEIGPGHGGFALDHAAAHPELDLVLIETRRADVELIRARAAKRGLQNLIAFQGDAKLLLPHFFQAGSLDAVHVQFPDPWWKTRHHKRRMVDVELAAQLRGLLRQGGQVDFRTDVPAYAREAVTTWELAGFVNLDGRGELWTGAPETLSTRERRYAQTGQPVFRARFANPEVAAGAAPGPAPSSLPSPAADRTGRDWTDLRRK